jgi:hypothetical protein
VLQWQQAAASQLAHCLRRATLIHPPPVPLAAPAGVHAARYCLSLPSQPTSCLTPAAVSSSGAGTKQPMHTFLRTICTVPKLNSQQQACTQRQRFLQYPRFASHQPPPSLAVSCPHCFHPATVPCPTQPCLIVVSFRLVWRAPASARVSLTSATQPVTGSGTHVQAERQKVGAAVQEKRAECGAAVGSATVQGQQPLSAAADAPATTAAAATGAQ